jgi:hypothetical protein
MDDADRRIFSHRGQSRRNDGNRRTIFPTTGVNIAARLAALAEPEGIRSSSTIRGRIPYTFADIREQSVENMGRPMRALRNTHRL